MACGFISACLWFRASTAKVTTDNNELSTELINPDPSVPGQFIYVVSTAMAQSRMNRNAALFTGLAVLFQALSTLIPSN